ncbi:MAG: glycosyltransferase [Alphaproteobacteria bacterium]|nr:glycosyltransferase [Alphaproteobacteria bacterium]
MRISHIGKYYPPDQGGIESVTQTLAEGMAAAGHDVEVVCFGAASESYVANGVRVVRCRELARPASQPLAPGYLLAAIRSARWADVVHLHYPNAFAALVLASGVLNSPTVIHWHSDVVDKGALGALLRPLETRSLRRATRIIATSQAYLDASAPLAPFRDKTVPIPIGIPSPRPNPEAAIPAPIAAFIGGRRYVFALGRMTAYKGFEHLIDAASDLPDDVCVVIGGGGELLDVHRERVARQGLSSRVLLPGRLSDEATTALFRQAALFCLPSVLRSEAFGVVLLEALSQGVPLVTTAVPGSGMSWVNRDGVTGFVAPVGDPAALAAACNRILDDPATGSRLASEARARFQAEFTAETFVERVGNLYDAVRNTSQN